MTSDLYRRRFDDTEKDRADMTTIEATIRAAYSSDAIRTRVAEQCPSAITAGARFCKPWSGLKSLTQHRNLGRQASQKYRPTLGLSRGRGPCSQLEDCGKL